MVCNLIELFCGLSQGVDIRHNKDRKVHRKEPKSQDIYLRLLVKVRTIMKLNTDKHARNSSFKTYCSICLTSCFQIFSFILYQFTFLLCVVVVQIPVSSFWCSLQQGYSEETLHEQDQPPPSGPVPTGEFEPQCFSCRSCVTCCVLLLGLDNNANFTIQFDFYSQSCGSIPFRFQFHIDSFGICQVQYTANFLKEKKSPN